MSRFQSDELSVWRRACLLAESLREARSSHPNAELSLRDASQLSTRCAAMIAAAGADYPDGVLTLSRLAEASASIESLLAQLVQIDHLGYLDEDEAALLQSESASLLESVTSLIRSLRSSE